VQAKIVASLKPGLHCNSNKPLEDYLIPLKLTWALGTLDVAEIVYPKPTMAKSDFSPNPVSVYTGDFEIVTKFKVPADAKPGFAAASGKLRYQSCDDRQCFSPKVVDINLPVDVVK